MSPVIGSATLEWVLASDEPAARWVVLTQLLDRPPDDPEVQAAHRSVLADPRTGELIERLGDWDDPGPLSGHDSSAYAQFQGPQRHGRGTERSPLSDAEPQKRGHAR